MNMANAFAGSEIVEIGIQIEKNGADFYKILAQQSKDKKAAGIFKYLAEQELKHITVFKEILTRVQKYQPHEAYPGEYFAYMNALASEYVFTQKNKGREIAEKIKSDKEAVNMGIGFEKDSIIFYIGIEKSVPDKEKGLIDELIKQERDHLKRLTELKSNL